MVHTVGLQAGVGHAVWVQAVVIAAGVVQSVGVQQVGVMHTGVAQGSRFQRKRVVFWLSSPFMKSGIEEYLLICLMSASYARALFIFLSVPASFSNTFFTLFSSFFCLFLKLFASDTLTFLYSRSSLTVSSWHLSILS